jgi:hypothetical protein
MSGLIEELPMKKSDRPKSKLTLCTQVIRTLDPIELQRIAGGDPASALCPTHRFCTQLC